MVINHGGISGGKDSTALLLWMVHESGYPLESLDFTFSDTGNEAPETYAFVQMLSDRVHPIQTIKPPLDFYELAKYRKRFPSPLIRFCTQELKMKPSKAHIDALTAAGHTVINHTGVRATESADRAKMQEREVPWLSYFGVEEYRPLLRWTLEDVWAIHKKYDIPRNALYDKGCVRVGCLPCIMSQKKELINIALRMPERFNLIRQAEINSSEGRSRGVSTFFYPRMVPLRYRGTVVSDPGSEKEISASPLAPDALPFDPADFPAQVTLRKAEGERAVALIDDVIRWAIAGIGETETLDFDDLDEPPTCDSRSGLCE